MHIGKSSLTRYQCIGGEELSATFAKVADHMRNRES
jgi:hypothetical protein